MTCEISGTLTSPSSPTRNGSYRTVEQSSSLLRAVVSNSSYVMASAPVETIAYPCSTQFRDTPSCHEYPAAKETKWCGYTSPEQVFQDRPIHHQPHDVTGSSQNTSDTFVMAAAWADGPGDEAFNDAPDLDDNLSAAQLACTAGAGKAIASLFRSMLPRRVDEPTGALEYVSKGVRFFGLFRYRRKAIHSYGVGYTVLTRESLVQ